MLCGYVFSQTCVASTESTGKDRTREKATRNRARLLDTHVLHFMPNPSAVQITYGQPKDIILGSTKTLV